MVDILNGAGGTSRISGVFPVVAKVASYPLTASDGTVLMDATAAPVTATLPAAGAAGVSGRVYCIKKTDSTSNKVTIATTGGELIDGATTVVLTINDQTYSIQSDGAGWHIIGQSGPHPYAQLSDNTNQNPVNTSPHQLVFSTNDEIQGISHTGGSGDVTVNEPGVYWIMAAPQFGKNAGTVGVTCDVWLRKNVTDVPNSNARGFLQTSSSSADVIVSQASLRLVAGDVIKVYISVSTTTDTPGVKAITPAGEPAIPSVIFTINKISD